MQIFQIYQKQSSQSNRSVYGFYFVGTLVAALSMVASVSLAAYAKPARINNLKEGDVVDYRKCQIDRTSCVCAPGLLPQTFFGDKGARFYQCLKANCAKGEQMQISRSAGGKRTTACKKIQFREYAEPKWTKQPTQAVKIKKGGR